MLSGRNPHSTEIAQADNTKCSCFTTAAVFCFKRLVRGCFFLVFCFVVTFLSDKVFDSLCVPKMLRCEIKHSI